MVCLGVLGGGGGDQHEWVLEPTALARRRLAAGQLDVVGGRLPHERPDDVHVLRPGARVLELGEGGDERELAADAAVDVVERGQPELRARAVEVDASALEAPFDGAVGLAPEGAPGGGAGHAGAERVDGELALAVGVDVGDERGAGGTWRSRRRGRGRA